MELILQHATLIIRKIKVLTHVFEAQNVEFLTESKQIYVKYHANAK